MTTTSEKSTQQAVDYQVEAAVLGGVGEILRPEQVSEFVATAVAGARLENQRVCLVVPDGTRTCPLPLLLQAMREGLASASQVTVVIALGTHPDFSGSVGASRHGQLELVEDLLLAAGHLLAAGAVGEVQQLIISCVRSPVWKVPPGGMLFVWSET